MRSKHNRDILSNVLPPPSANLSPLWKRVRSLLPLLMETVKWGVGRGDLNFWTDNWMVRDPLQRLVDSPIPPELQNLQVKDVFGLSGPLPPSRVFSFLPQQLIDEIFNGGFTTSDVISDCIWPLETSGTFSLRSAWNLSRASSPFIQWASWIWQAPLPPKFSVFIWRVLQNATPVNNRVQAKGVALASRCCCCFEDENASPQSELIAHLFLFGHHARVLWTTFGRLCGVPPLIHNTVEGKLAHWRSAAAPEAAPKIVRFLLLILILWELWRSRNEAVFDNSPMTIMKSVVRVRWWAKLVIGTEKMDSLEWPRRVPPLKSIFTQTRAASVLVKWRLSSPGWVKLNVDGSALSNPSPSGGGGICGNDIGAFLLGFSAAYGVDSINLAKLRAIHDWMLLCLEKDLDKIIVESDSNLVIASLTTQSKTPWKREPWISRINCLRRLGHFSFSHTLREDNGPANDLARLGSLLQQSSIHHNSRTLPL
ncbi:uncharacterized protein LOC131247149 [Magnolia sinica]|uniref:uncharacterized protein LOC131247149 n=1 Tax=Magnolia sinica TaxID=86752 RepID=UPI0026584635|nr:uncharacterized protein LOC131247149 [Magnolia sinica]